MAEQLRLGFFCVCFFMGVGEGVMGGYCFFKSYTACQTLYQYFLRQRDKKKWKKEKGGGWVVRLTPHPAKYLYFRLYFLINTGGLVYKQIYAFMQNNLVGFFLRNKLISIDVQVSLQSMLSVIQSYYKLTILFMRKYHTQIMITSWHFGTKYFQQLTTNGSTYMY